MAVAEEQIVKPYHQTDRFGLYEGDCRSVLRSLAENSVDSVVTDPPYELTANKRGGIGAASLNLNSPAGRSRVTTGFMGQRWDGTGAPFDVDTWIECLRVLKPGGHLLAFGGSRTYHRLACAIEDAGFEIRDQIQWIYGSGFPKSLDVGKAIDAAAGAEREAIGPSLAARPNAPTHKVIARGEFSGQAVVTLPTTDAAKQWNGWGTALKPAHEPIVLARKPLIGTVAENVLQHGTGGLNIDGCRIGTDTERGNRYNGKPPGGGVSQGIYIGLEQPEVWDVPAGRWPANVIHDGSEEVLARFPETDPSRASMRGTMGESPFSGIDGSGRNPFTDSYRGHSDNGGSAARFFYCAKATQEDRNEGLNGSRNGHPTVKPISLARYLCRLITPPNGVVLDPFAGSGSLGIGALLEGFSFVGIEKEPEYCEIAKRRLDYWAAHYQPELFRPDGTPNLPVCDTTGRAQLSLLGDSQSPDRATA